MNCPLLVSKKDLEQRYHLADTTVYKTLQACGLSTAKRRYTEAEISERFDVARQLLTHRYTYAQVRQYFAMKVATTTEDYDYQNYEETTSRTVQTESQYRH